MMTATIDPILALMISFFLFLIESHPLPTYLSIHLPTYLPTSSSSSINVNRRFLQRTDKRNAIEGRTYLDSDLFDNIVGLIEKTRFACLPLSLAERYSISRLIDSRNCYELTQRGFVISRTDKLERIRTIEEIFACDKGGMIFSPRVGLHENVAVLNYENEYSNLILKHNLSNDPIVIVVVWK
jgi:DNA polymerase elongation subunit (family B)